LEKRVSLFAQIGLDCDPPPIAGYATRPSYWLKWSLINYWPGLTILLASQVARIYRHGSPLPS
jgi:hypothetical protein